MNFFKESKQKMEQFLKAEHIINDRYSVQNNYCNQQKRKSGKKQEVYRVSGSKHLFLERVYKARDISKNDFAILKSNKFYIFRGNCGIVQANFGIYCLIEMLKDGDISFELADYTTFCNLLNFEDKISQDEQDALSDVIPILSLVEDNTVKIVAERVISKKLCTGLINIISYRTDTYVLSKMNSDLLTELKITKSIRKMIRQNRIYFEYEGKESVVFRTYFSDYNDWKKNSYNLKYDISSFCSLDYKIRENESFGQNSIKIDKCYLWRNDDFVLNESRWLYDDDTYFITIDSTGNNRQNKNQIHPYYSIILCNNPSKCKVQIEYIEAKYKVKAKAMNKNSNLSFLHQNNMFYVQQAKNPTSLFMVYSLNGLKIKEVNKKNINNLNSYVYTFYETFYIWKGDASTDEEFACAVSFVESRSMNYFLVDTEQFYELLGIKEITTYSVPSKIDNRTVKIYGFKQPSIVPLEFINIDDQAFEAYLVDFVTFVVIIKLHMIEKKTLMELARIYGSIDQYFFEQKKRKSPVYILENIHESSFMCYFTDPRTKCCLNFFGKIDALTSIAKSNK